MSQSYILGIETSTNAGGVAIAGEKGVLVSLYANLEQSHSRQTVSLVKQAAEILGIAPNEFGAVGVSVGPGSFTGVRVGMSVAKGLCLAGSIPLIGISTLEALGWRAVAPEGGLICPILDARRGEVFAALFQRSPDPEADLERLHQDWCGTLGEWLSRLEKLTSRADGGSPILFTGDAADRFREPIEERLGARARFAGPLHAHPSPDAVALLAWKRWRADPHCGDGWETLQPEYTRWHDARPPKRNAVQTGESRSRLPGETLVYDG